MRLSTTLLCLPLLATADQTPLAEKAAGWIAKAKDMLPNAPPNPVDAGAAKVAEKTVTKFTWNNWERKLAPSSDGPQEWLIYVTGGNKTCYGNCTRSDAAWNVRLRQTALFTRDC